MIAGTPIRILIVLLMATAALPQTAPRNARGVIEGVVTRFGTDEPLGKVEILIVGGSSADEAVETLTDRDGRFRLSNLTPGRYTILARRGGYANPTRNGLPL
jgi:hypothetical protein